MSSSRRVSQFVLLILAFGLYIVTAAAQETRGTISGTVTDSSGAAVMGASVTLVNVGTAATFSGETNSTGQYRFLFLNPGTYKLTVALAGFKGIVRDKIELHVSQSAGIDVALEVGAMTDSVTVSASAALLDAEKADRGVVIGKARIEDLPMSMQNPIMLSNLSTGIISSGDAENINPFSNSSISSWSVNGSQTNNVEFVIDGAPNNAYSGALNRIAYVPPSDAVAEFKVVTGLYDAQYGRTAGGVINVAIKSGTNSYHGSIYDYEQNSIFNANTFSNNSKGSPKEGNGLTQYGFTVGGPLHLPKIYNGRDKTFFFFAAESFGNDLNFPLESAASVPTVAMKDGDFSKVTDASGRLITIYDPLTGKFDANNKWIRVPFAGNMIPKDRMNPVAQKMLSLYPDPNTSTSGSPAWQNNWVLAPNPGIMDFQNYTTRVDHTFSPKERVYGRWSWNRHESARIKNAIPSAGADRQTAGKTNNGGVIDSVTILSNIATFNIRASLTKWQEFLPGYAEEFNLTDWWPQSLVSQLPIQTHSWYGTRSYPTRILFQQRSTPLPGAVRVPYLSPSSFGYLGSNTYLLEPTNVFSLQPNFAIVYGRHTIKTGLDFRVTRFTQQQPNYSAGRLNFDTGFTRADYLTADALSGNSIASMLLGAPASGQVDNNIYPYWQTLYYAPWVQDDIKVTKRLTVNLGLRWDYNGPPSERFDRMNRGFFPTVVNPISARIDQNKFPGYKVNGGIGFAGVDGLPRTPMDADYNNLQPRLGAAFQLNTKTVMRGGWGIFYMSPVSRGSNLGFSQTTNYVASLDSNRTPSNNVANPFPEGILLPSGSSLGLATYLGSAPSYSNTSARVPYVQQFSFGIQRQLPGNMTLDMSYVGSRTKSAIVSKPVNELSLADLALGDPTKGGNPNYLNAQVPNPFAGLIPGTSFNNTTIARSQLLRPFPAFASFNMTDRNDGKIWYNSLQVTLDKRFSHGVNFLATYTRSKDIEALTYLNAQDENPGRALAAWDRPNRVSLAPAVELPFGPDRKFLNNTNGIVRRLVGGWQCVMTAVLQDGVPMGLPANATLLGDPRLDNPTFSRWFKTGYIDTNGVTRNTPSGEQPVWLVRQPNTLRTSPLRSSNIRDPWRQTYDVSLVKKTRIREGMNMNVRVDAFNVLNTPIFNRDPSVDPTSTSFGRLFPDTGQWNKPRILQLGFKFEW